eukprot:gene4975-biopygen8565
MPGAGRGWGSGQSTSRSLTMRCSVWFGCKRDGCGGAPRGRTPTAACSACTCCSIRIRDCRAGPHPTAGAAPGQRVKQIPIPSQAHALPKAGVTGRLPPGGGQPANDRPARPAEGRARQDGRPGMVGGWLNARGRSRRQALSRTESPSPTHRFIRRCPQSAWEEVGCYPPLYPPKAGFVARPRRAGSTAAPYPPAIVTSDEGRVVLWQSMVRGATP